MILIDYRDHRPIYEQIVERYKELILKGVLEPDSQLPSVRSLAMELSINPNTIQRAYAELERQGYISSVKGKGNFIATKDQLILEKQNEIICNIDKNVKEAKSMGIPREQIVHIIDEYYREVDDGD